MYLQRITSKQILITKLDIELMRLFNTINHYLVCDAASKVQQVSQCTQHSNLLPCFKASINYVSISESNSFTDDSSSMCNNFCLHPTKFPATLLNLQNCCPYTGKLCPVGSAIVAIAIVGRGG